MSEFSSADADFHSAIVRAGNNPLIEQFYTSLRERQRRMTTDSLARDPGQIDGIVDDHARLAVFIEGGDVHGFEHAVDRHMRRVHGWNLGTAL